MSGSLLPWVIAELFDAPDPALYGMWMLCGYMMVFTVDYSWSTVKTIANKKIARASAIDAAIKKHKKSLCNANHKGFIMMLPSGVSSPSLQSVHRLRIHNSSAKPIIQN